MFKEDGFWECERDSPLFNRSGLSSESNLKMILPKFRNLHRISKSILKLDYITINNIKDENTIKNSKKDDSNNILNNSLDSSVTVSGTTETTGTPNTTVVPGTNTNTNTTNSTSKGPTTNTTNTNTNTTNTNTNTTNTNTNTTNTGTTKDTNTNTTTTKDTNSNSNSKDTNSNSNSKDIKESGSKGTGSVGTNTGVGGVPVTVTENKNVYKLTEELKRIFKLDAERTFKSENYREQFYNNLCLVFERLGDYHQGEGFVIALLSIYLNSIEVINVMRVMSNHYLPGYFSSKPRKYVRDSKVLMLLLERRNTKLYKVLDELIVPEAFVSKWFIGLGVHIFDFEAISTLLNYLFEQGQIFLFKLGLSFFSNFSDQILENPDVSFVLKLLRLDDEVIPKDDSERSKIYYDVLMGSFEQDVTEPEVNELRLKVEKQMKQDDELRELRQKMLDEEDEIVFSDEE